MILAFCLTTTPRSSSGPLPPCAPATSWPRTRSACIPGPFTILELRLLHEAVVGRKFQRDTFRRLMEPQLTGTGKMTSGTRGRPAELFRHKH